MKPFSLVTAVVALSVAACNSPHSNAGDAINDGGMRDSTPVASPDASSDASNDLVPLIPLVIGYTWQSTTTSSGDGPTTTCNDTETVTGQIMVDGRNAFVLTYAYVCPTQTETSTFYTAALGGDRYESRSSTSTDGIWYVQDPPSDGHQWASDPQGMFVYTWHRSPPVTVPAGTFDDCWLEVTTPDGSDQQFTMCRGVGSVEADESFTTGYTIHDELFAKSF